MPKDQLRFFQLAQSVRQSGRVLLRDLGQNRIIEPPPDTRCHLCNFFDRLKAVDSLPSVNHAGSREWSCGSMNRPSGKTYPFRATDPDLKNGFCQFFNKKGDPIRAGSNFGNQLVGQALTTRDG